LYGQFTLSDTSEDLTFEPLTPKQAAFVSEYLIDLNGKQAALRAGYAPANAEVQASTLLSYPKVAAAVARGMAQRLARVNMTADTVLSEMATLAKSNVEHYVIDNFGNVALAEGAPENAMAAIQSIKKKIRHLQNGTIEYDVELRLWDKPGPLRLMGKHAGITAFADRVEITGKDGGPVQVAAAKLAELPQDQLKAKIAELVAENED